MGDYVKKSMSCDLSPEGFEYAFPSPGPHGKVSIK